MSEKYPWLWWGSNKDIPHVSNVFVVAAPLPPEVQLSPPDEDDGYDDDNIVAVSTSVPLPPSSYVYFYNISQTNLNLDGWGKFPNGIKLCKTFSSSKSLKTASLAHATTCYLQCMIGAEQKMKLQGNFEKVSSIWAFKEGWGGGADICGQYYCRHVQPPGVCLFSSSPA